VLKATTATAARAVLNLRIGILQVVRPLSPAGEVGWIILANSNRALSAEQADPAIQTNSLIKIK